MVKQIFLKYLSQFEATLHQFGYFKVGEEACSTGNYKDGLSVEYVNNQIRKKIYIGFILWEKTEGISLSMSMFEIPRNNTLFSLFDFLDNHNLNDKIASKCPSDGNFELTVKTYFEALETLFKNELNDQITGKTFENHMEVQNESWNLHRDAAYQMELEVINKFKNSKKH